MQQQTRNRIVSILAWLLAISFFFGSLTKFAPGETFFGPSYAVKFVEWGYPSWVRFIVGAGELLGGILLIIPRFRFLGGLLLTVILEGAIVTHIINADPFAESIAAPVTLVLVATVAVLSAPFGLRLVGQLRTEG